MDSSRRERQTQLIKLDKSRNSSLNKSSTILILKKPIKSITPIKGVIQKSAHAPAVIKENTIVKQNVELKKENAELIRLLKKSKEIIKGEIGKLKQENQLMKKLAGIAWDATEGKIDEKLREQVKGIIGIKANTGTTNHSEGMEDTRKADIGEEVKKMRGKIASEEKRTTTLRTKMQDAKTENKAIKEYMGYAMMRKKNVEKRWVDSENIDSEEEEAVPIEKVKAGFIRSLLLSGK
eukprot:TRINITY_DN3546_c0_g1_i1.p4 TRINITY_DN3546_c0_g1~~TRINITY_DN3546_c0_g1_i1.p4  ORF type:complete len:236 (+),score=54.17 TRINITY_DN3546_c0_g1_i1:3404-4111(+)